MDKIGVTSKDFGTIKDATKSSQFHPKGDYKVFFETAKGVASATGEIVYYYNGNITLWEKETETITMVKYRDIVQLFRVYK